MISRTWLSVGAVLISFVLVISISSAAINGGGANLLNSSSGPVYTITNVFLPDQTSWIDSGTTLTPNITIRNLGSDDTRTDTVQITASLGTNPLIPKKSTIDPMKKGEEREVTLQFLIPETIQSDEYPLIISIDPNQLGRNIQDNDVIAPRLLKIRTAVPKVKVSSCGCS